MQIEAMSSQRKVGPNAPVQLAADPFTSAALIQEVGGRYASAVLNGEMYTITSGLVATPAASPLGAAGIPIIALYNPINSGYYALIRRLAGLTTASGTVSPKGIAINFGVNQTITAALNAISNNNLIGGPVDGIMKGYAATALTGAAALTHLRPLNAVGNTAAQANILTQAEDLEDSLALMPGSVIALAPYVLGTANEHIGAIVYALRKI